MMAPLEPGSRHRMGDPASVGRSAANGRSHQLQPGRGPRQSPCRSSFEKRDQGVIRRLRQRNGCVTDHKPPSGAGLSISACAPRSSGRTSRRMRRLSQCCDHVGIVAPWDARRYTAMRSWRFWIRPPGPPAGIDPARRAAHFWGVVPAARARCYRRPVRIYRRRAWTPFAAMLNATAQARLGMKRGHVGGRRLGARRRGCALARLHFRWRKPSASEASLAASGRAGHARRARLGSHRRGRRNGGGAGAPAPTAGH